MRGGQAGSTSQHFSHPSVEPDSVSYLLGWPSVATLRPNALICRDVSSDLPTSRRGALPTPMFFTRSGEWMRLAVGGGVLVVGSWWINAVFVLPG
jgi:hypothetical protein